MNNLKKYFFATALAGVLYLGIAQTSFGQDLANGDFTDFTTAPSGEGSEYGEGLRDGTTWTGGAVLSDWTNAGYAYVYLSGANGTETINGQYGDNFGLAVSFLPAPFAGYTGNYIASDPVYEQGALSETVTDLTIGKTYAVSFYYAGDQQNTYSTNTTAYWAVSLGSTTLDTATLNVTAGTFSGWEEATLDFTATAASETLSFLAEGGPTGDPPFTLLADVTMTAVPEPIASSCWTLLFGMLILLGNRAWRRYQKRLCTAT